MTARDNGCQSYRQLIGALHVSYLGSQLQYAESYLTANPRTKLVSLMIGANDLFLLLDSCAQAADVDGCILAGLPGCSAPCEPTSRPSTRVCGLPASKATSWL